MIFVIACTQQSVTPTATSLHVTLSATAIFKPTDTNTPESYLTSTSTPKPPDLLINSPNGEFLAEFDNAYSHPAYEPQVIKILDKNGSLRWEIPYQHEIAISDPHPSLTIYGWSNDSRYLYFYYEYSPDGGDRAFWWDGFNLQRINAQTGEIENVIPEERERFVSFAFSPDETKIAYSRAQDNPSIIFIRDLVTGAEKSTHVIISSIKYIRVGNIIWSHSGNYIAFQTESDDYVAQTLYLDPSSMEQKKVREYLVDTSYFDGWNVDENLVFLDINNGKGYIVHLDPITGEIIEVGTPTPRP